MSRRGFTVVELLFGLVLGSVVLGAMFRMVLSAQRGYEEQSMRVDLNNALRSVAAALPAELREMDASDPAGSDIVSMSATALAYRAMRNTYFLCQPPNNGESKVILDATNWYGLDEIRTDHWVVVFQENDPTTRLDDGWVHANIASRNTGTACPGGEPSITLTLNTFNPAVPGLAGVVPGAPLRGYVINGITITYDNPAWYLGARRLPKGSGGAWTASEPLFGPIAAGGLSFVYYDRTGAVTATPGDVASIGVTVVGVTRGAVRRGAEAAVVQDTVTTRIALRNNRRY